MLAAAASSWFVPAVIASVSDHESDGVQSSLLGSDEGESSTEHDVDYESTASEASTSDSDTIAEEGSVAEEEKHDYDPMGLQIWSDGECYF